MKEEQSDSLIIEGLSGKIGILERRRAHLKRKLNDWDGYADTPSAEFDRHEIAAIDAAVRAMRYHASTLRPEIDPVVHLARLVDAVNGGNAFHVNERAKEAETALTELL